MDRLHRIAMTGLKDVMDFILKKRFPFCAAVGLMYVTDHPFKFDAEIGWIIPYIDIPWRP